MQLSTFRDTVQRALTSFAWDQWAQLGVLALPKRTDRWAADPEALVLFTLEVGRSDPRLFDEVLDWLLTNERLIGVQRLWNLCTDDEDRDLVGAALAWMARWQPRVRLPARAIRRAEGIRRVEGQPRPLFRTVMQVQHPDPAFLSVGLVKPETQPSHKSRPPDPTLPISFAFRMRLLFGVGSRAEVMRYLLTTPAPDVSAQLVAEAAGYAKRNVAEALSALTASGLVTAFDRGNERRYCIDRLRWGQLLGLTPETWPGHRDWPQLLRALRRLSRWLEAPGLDELSPYMLASEARGLMAEIESDLTFAGFSVSSTTGGLGEQYWGSFTSSVESVLSALQASGTAEGRSSPSREPRMMEEKSQL
ncbi:MAG: hypothetical protein KGJ86_08365, partial [Chloroflexota bacterium]|nr:hypothetical protein [Chloroflexota bacterium]